MCRSLCRWLPVLFVVALIAWCYWVYTTDIALPMVQLKPGQVEPIGTHELGIAYLIAFNCLFGLGMISFVCAIFTDPGRIPEAWAVGSEDAAEAALYPQLQTLEKKHDGSRRVCRKSKPNMYKPFYLFIMYMASLTMFMLVTMTPTFVHDVTSMDEVMIDFTMEFRVTLTYLVLCLLCAGLVCFFGFHTYLLAFNYTTIEFLEKRGCNPPPDHKNRYDIGAWGNMSAVLGSNPLVWILPVRWTCEGDGLSFKLNPEWYPSAKGR